MSANAWFRQFDNRGGLLKFASVFHHGDIVEEIATERQG